LLRPDSEAAGKALLRDSCCDPCTDECAGQVFYRLQNYAFILTQMEALVLFDLLLQILRLYLGRLALGFPKARPDTGGALLFREFRERVLKAANLRLGNSVLFFVLNHLVAPRSRMASIPFGSPVSLFTWKNSIKALPVAPSGS
jgi:hypothetical protein